MEKSNKKQWEEFVKEHKLYISLTYKDPNIVYGGVSFWPYDPNLCVPFDIVKKDDAEYIKTNLYGKELMIKALSDPGSIYISISFKDKSSYKKGRYINLFKTDAFIDFNFSKNLLCAYSDRYNCEIPENDFDFGIMAGEKIFERSTMAEYYLNKSTAFNVKTVDGKLRISPRGTDSAFHVDINTPINELIDIIWGNGVERGKKNNREEIKSLLGTDKM